jgi:pilus assembly protein CpaF
MTTDEIVAIVCTRLASLSLPAGGSRATSDLTDPARRIAKQLLPLGTNADIDVVATAAIAHIQGLGPLQRFLADPSVNEIMVNNGGDVWVERGGEISFAGRLDLEVTPRLLERILSPLGRRLDRLAPIVDARLPDGSRVCAVIPPIAIDGACLTLRRFGIHLRHIDDFAAAGTHELLAEIIDARCNVLISGATSSGKTSLLNALASRIAPSERIVTLEDTAELRLDAPHVLRLETRQATVDGTSAVTMTDLVRTSLRLRPDRIVLGEIRGGEVVDMLNAMNTGHDGSLTTCHANGPVDALRRVESLVIQHSPSWPLHAVRDNVRSSIDIVIHVERLTTGERRVARILELASPDSDDRHRDLATNGCRVGDLSRGRR